MSWQRVIVLGLMLGAALAALSLGDVPIAATLVGIAGGLAVPNNGSNERPRL